MPDVRKVRKQLPLKIFSKPWQCCAGKSITVRKALGKSRWTLLATCDHCGRAIAISKYGVGFY
jgi:hypothetical protein